MMKPTRSWTTGLGLKTLVTLLLSALLMSCGSSKKYDEFMPTRILSLGDAFSYVDFSTLSAVNPNTSIAPDTGKTDHWIWTYAAGYGLANLGAAPSALTPGSGKNVVFFNTSTQPSTAGARSKLGTIAEIRAQIRDLPTPQAKDLVILSVGMGDIFARADALGNAPATATDLNDMYNIGLEYINLADSIYQRGYKYVLFLSSVDYSSSQYVSNQSVTYKSNIAVLTDKLYYGTHRNCNGGCTKDTDVPYPSGEGVRKYDLYAFMRNIVARTPTSVQTNVNNNTVNGLTSSPLCLYPSLLSTCVPNSLSDTSGLPYLYSGDLFFTPLIHRHIGNVLFNYSRSTAGF